jgi:maltooligosyltrehalose synthase
MDYALIGFILAMALMAFIVAGSYSPEAPTHIIERKRSTYRQALNILRNAPDNPNYRRLAQTTGMAYAAVEDPAVFNETHLAADIAAIVPYPNT